MASNGKSLITTTISKVDSVRVRPTTRLDGHQVKRVEIHTATGVIYAVVCSMLTPTQKAAAKRRAAQRARG